MKHERPEPSRPDFLLSVVREPARIRRLTLTELDDLVPQARRAGLLARLALALQKSGTLDSIPAAPREHLKAAVVLSEKHHRDTIYELQQLTIALKDIVSPIILLKGAAYLCAHLPPAEGRVFSDIDILVPKKSLAAVEAMLGLSGWRFGELDPYDEQYYRRWMHQLPPMAHLSRQSVLDIHHTIVPETSRIDLSAEALSSQAVRVPGAEHLAVLAPPDMVLHTATHLFNEGEFARGLRDLDDINQLLRHFALEPDFWGRLVERSAELNLGRPLFYALRYTTAMLGTPVPVSALAALEAAAPSRSRLKVMDLLFDRALRSPHPQCRDSLSAAALWSLYVRAHYLRMPLRLLLPHLIRKAARPRKDQPALAV